MAGDAHVGDGKKHVSYKNRKRAYPIGDFRTGRKCGWCETRDRYFQWRNAGGDLAVEIVEAGCERANGMGRTEFPRVQRVGEPPNISPGEGEVDFPG